MKINFIRKTTTSETENQQLSKSCVVCCCSNQQVSLKLCFTSFLISLSKLPKILLYSFLSTVLIWSKTIQPFFLSWVISTCWYLWTTSHWATTIVFKYLFIYLRQHMGVFSHFTSDCWSRFTKTIWYCFKSILPDFRSNASFINNLSSPFSCIFLNAFSQPFLVLIRFQNNVTFFKNEFNLSYIFLIKVFKRPFEFPIGITENIHS
jgi:hypothetical protein